VPVLDVIALLSQFELPFLLLLFLCELDRKQLHLTGECELLVLKLLLLAHSVGAFIVPDSPQLFVLALEVPLLLEPG